MEPDRGVPKPSTSQQRGNLSTGQAQEVQGDDEASFFLSSPSDMGAMTLSKVERDQMQDLVQGLVDIDGLGRGLGDSGSLI